MTVTLALCDDYTSPFSLTGASTKQLGPPAGQETVSPNPTGAPSCCPGMLQTEGHGTPLQVAGSSPSVGLTSGPNTTVGSPGGLQPNSEFCSGGGGGGKPSAMFPMLTSIGSGKMDTDVPPGTELTLVTHETASVVTQV